MAEIKIVKKAPIWPWILLIALVLAALIYYFGFYKEDNVINDDTMTEEVVTTDQNDQMMGDMSNVAIIDEYRMYIDNPQMGLDHEYTSTGLMKLVDATRQTASALDVDINADLAEADAKAGEIKNNPKSLVHANMIRDASLILTRAMKTIQSERSPDCQPEFNQVQMAANNINVDKPTLDQKDAVKAFFNSSEKLLTKIKNDHGKAK